MSKTGNTLQDFPTFRFPDVIDNQVRIDNFWNEKQEQDFHTVKAEIAHDRHMFMEYRAGRGISEDTYDVESLEYNLNEIREEMPEVITQFGQWIVAVDGLHVYDGTYHIHSSRINERDWVSHMSEKQWVNIADLTRALYHGSRIYRFLDTQ